MHCCHSKWWVPFHKLRTTSLSRDYLEAIVMVDGGDFHVIDRHTNDNAVSVTQCSNSAGLPQLIIGAQAPGAVTSFNANVKARVVKFDGSNKHFAGTG